MSDFISDWINVSIGGHGREDLNSSDKFWLNAYKVLLDEKNDEFIFSGDLLYRVHNSGGPKPNYNDYSDYGSYQDEYYNKASNFWKKCNDVDLIEFDNHWVSFTDSIDVINSGYFATKGLRGFVIIIKPKKSINIHPLKTWGFDEREVVAPMDKTTLVEILPFNEFIKKYKK